MRIAVGIITKGRPAILAATACAMAQQTMPPATLIIAPASSQDVAGLPADLPGLVVAPGPTGTTLQRNTVLEHAAGHDLLVFFDDDFLPHPRFLEICAAVFAARPGLVCATGTVLRDGASGAGFSLAEGQRLLAELPPHPADPLGCSATFGAYGCNMVVRVAPVLAGGYRFDPDLPLYGWLEDLDFSRRISGGGVVQMHGALGIHLGIKLGRQSGLRLGYSQVANPIYLARRGSLSWGYALKTLLRNLARNLARAPRPEAHVDRRGRLRGNLLALGDVLRGRMRPDRVLAL